MLRDESVAGECQDGYDADPPPVQEKRQQQHPEKSLSIRDRNRIKTMISFIETHFAEPITLADIAAAASISPRECTRCFKSIINDSPVNYLMNHRISVAADMLLHTDCTVTDAAMCTGFENLSYFAKIFKRNMNITPKHYQLLSGSQ
jgi:transcriptional regulator GlxA family with amidase domain